MLDILNGVVSTCAIVSITVARRIYLISSLSFSCENIEVWITHIGGYPSRYSKRISDRLKSEKVDLFICGHSHILRVMNDKKHDLLHINPGAIGKHGFHNKRTMVRFEIDGKRIENLEIIEFNRKSSDSIQ